MICSPARRTLGLDTVALAMSASTLGADAPAVFPFGDLVGGGRKVLRRGHAGREWDGQESAWKEKGGGAPLSTAGEADVRGRPRSGIRVPRDGTPDTSQVGLVMAANAYCICLSARDRSSSTEAAQLVDVPANRLQCKFNYVRGPRQCAGRKDAVREHRPGIALWHVTMSSGSATVCAANHSEFACRHREEIDVPAQTMRVLR